MGFWSHPKFTGVGIFGQQQMSLKSGPRGLGGCVFALWRGPGQLGADISLLTPDVKAV